MKLNAYLEFNQITQTDLAKKLGVSVVFTHQFIKGKRDVPIKLCPVIERITGGAVTRQELRDDWADIWPELTPKETA